MSEKELTKEEEETIIGSNKYLNYKVDIAEILAFGNIPEFKDNAEKFLCAIEVGKFINKNGIGSQKNLSKFLHSLEVNDRIILLKQLNSELLGIMLDKDNKLFSPFISDTMKILIGPLKPIPLAHRLIKPSEY